MTSEEGGDPGPRVHLRGHRSPGRGGGGLLCHPVQACREVTQKPGPKGELRLHLLSMVQKSETPTLPAALESACLLPPPKGSASLEKGAVPPQSWAWSVTDSPVLDVSLAGKSGWRGGPGCHPAPPRAARGCLTAK